MAKAKKGAEPEVYDVPALAVMPEKPQPVTGNYEAIESVLEKWSAKVSKMDLSEGNLDEVQAIKKAAVSTRNQLDSKVAAAKKLLFNDPKSIFEARVKSLYALIAVVEGKADKVLGKLEQERIDSLNQVLDYYKEQFQEQYKLSGSYFSRVEYKKNYYNKGTEEKARKDDLEGQFKALKKEQNAYDAGVRLIENTCKGEPRLNAALWVKKLSVDDAAAIVEEINAEKQRLHDLDNEKTPASTAVGGAEEADVEVVNAGEEPSAGETKHMILGVPAGIDFSSDFLKRTKKKRVEIEYPCDTGDALKELFIALRQFGIKTKELQEEVTF
jgi:hypothetical protein